MLTREFIIDAIKGVDPSYEAMEHPLCRTNGSFSGSYGRWSWNYSAFRDCNLDVDQLYIFYRYLKETK